MRTLAMLLAPIALLAAVPETVTVSQAGTTVTINRTGFRLAISGHGADVKAHGESGLLLGPANALEACDAIEQTSGKAGDANFDVRTKSGHKAEVQVHVSGNAVEIKVTPASRQAVLLRTAGAAPGFGLGDHAVVGRPSFDTDITGYANDKFLSGQGLTRLVSNFAIYPKQRFAFLVWDPTRKMVRSTASEVAQGVVDSQGTVPFTYFLGNMHEIYRAYHQALNGSAYPVMLPKYDFLGVGWEAFGALGWDTNQKTVIESVDRYLALGYPIQWMVVGSGFWPKSEDRFKATTSFGMYDPTLYPDPKQLIQHFRAKKIHFLQGLRISFITDGPYSEEGVKHGYFIQENGKAKVFTIGFPKSPCYLLDAQNEAAVQWYDGLVHKWMEYGVDGFKEDLYGFGRYELRDDKLDTVNQKLMKQGIYVMGRNQYLGSPADNHRISDFNYDQRQDRGPVNTLALAYSSLPLGYPDIVGGTFGEGRFETKVTPRMKQYIMRNAQWASLHSSMGMGQPPWSFNDAQVEKVMLGAAKLHEQLHPYLYSQAVRWFHDGYPWTMTPLPIAYPQEEGSYNRDNDKVRSYEWMIGDALLAMPLYGNDYETANARDIYLPPGDWMDYDTGEHYKGGQTLKGFSLPVGKSPLLVGGTGIVVEKSTNGVVGRVYPVTQSSETEFWDSNAKLSRIRIAVKDWKKASVIDQKTKRRVASEWKRHALEFALQPGESYEVR